MLVPLLVALSTLQQAPQAAPDSAPPPARWTVEATRAVHPPVIDGRDTDAVWRVAPAMTRFLEYQPDMGRPSRLPTEAKVAYDDRDLYVFVRAFDDEPGTISRRLARRDVFPQGDRVTLVIDSYHDLRTGFEFGVTPSGSRFDASVSNDGDEDESWDGVWDVATTIDSLGWTAEFRIPLSQLRYAEAPTHTFGLAVARDIGRFNISVAWPEFRRDRAGMVNQLGELRHIDGISSPRRLEVLPYAVTKNVTTTGADGYGRAQRFSAGADVKYGVTSNLTLDATVNPDFGQVEADPAVLNLSAFETFYQEKRPFFIEGNSLLRFSVNCNNINCSSEGLYYSRRIGREPQLLGRYGDAGSPTATTILGAGKLTGRLASGLSIGALEAVTQRETGPHGVTIEPATDYALVRLNQDLRGGETGIGLIGTLVARDLDAATRPFLRSSALVGGATLRNRFLNRRYRFDASVTASRVAGSPAAMDATQRSSVHYYQRPDAALPYDPSRTALTGDAEQIRFGKVSGVVQGETSWQRISAGYEVNDLGYLQRADWQFQGTWVGLRFLHSTRWFREFSWNFNELFNWTASGLPLGNYLNTNLHVQLPFSWWVHAGVTAGGLMGTTYCDRCARGGPAIRNSRSFSPWFEIDGDARRALSPGLSVSYSRGSEGRSAELDVNPQLTARFTSRWQTTLGVYLGRSRIDAQWYGNFTDRSGVTHYTFAHLWQRTASLQLRLDYTASPKLTLQVYAEPFVSKGTYSDIREALNPRAAAYADRYVPYADTAVANHPGGFNFKQLRSNVVLRWEYLPGSTVYLVWTQGRSGYAGAEGTRSFAGDFGDILDLHPDNTFLIKVAHWLDW
jgi:hypothetical protein